METAEAHNHKMWEKQCILQGYIFQRTCHACPEQYDVVDQKGQMIAYLRLRHGSFTVTVPDVGGETILHCSPKGDGIFENDERMLYLNLAVDAIQKYYFNREWDEGDLW
jgi:hypothetical protein